MKKFIVSCTLTLTLSAMAFSSGGLGVSAANATMSPVGGSASLNVADIYHNNTVTDWNVVKSNLDAIYIKATEGSTYTDPNAAVNANGAQSVGLNYGFYDYFWPYAKNSNADVSNAAAQADFFYGFIKNYSYSCIPVLDLEENNGCTAAQIAADADAFIAEFESISGGQDIMIYTNQNFSNLYLDSSFANYKLWFASPSSSPSVTNVWSQYTMWQYGSGNVSGISGKVDIDHATSGILINSGGSTVSYGFTAILDRISQFMKNAFD